MRILGFNYHRAKPALFGFAFIVSATTVLAADITWVADESDDWNNPVNWSPQTVPTASDHVYINSGSVNVPVGASFNIMDWTGGEISGALTVGNGKVLNLSGVDDSTLLSAVLTNAGTIVWNGSGDFILSQSSVYNLAGGVFDVQDDQTIYADAGGEFINNAGTIQKSAGSGTTGIFARLDNSGTVDAQSGSLALEGGGFLGGAFAAETGASVFFDQGTFSLISGNPVTSGAGQVSFNSGYIIFSGPITNFNLAAGVLLGSNLVTGTLNWTGGGVSGALTVGSAGMLNIAGGYDLTLSSGC